MEFGNFEDSDSFDKYFEFRCGMKLRCIVVRTVQRSRKMELTKVIEFRIIIRNGRSL